MVSVRWSWLVVGALFLGGSSATAADTPTVAVLVARRDINSWTVLNEPEKWFKKVRYVKGDEPRDAITSFAQLKGMMTARPLAEDQPVKHRDVRKKPAGEPLASLLPKGMRAIALKMPPADANGFILPGSRVDVLVSTPKAKGKRVTKTLVENLLVVAVDTREVRGGERATDNVATLAVTLEQARTLSKALKTGTLRLVLRAPGK